MMDTLHINMLGPFSISINDKHISDRDNRSRKVWELLAYLIYHRNRTVSQQELIDLLWGEDDQGVNPSGALKAMLHRARLALDGLWPNAGKDLILRKGFGYVWNTKYPCELDIDVFEKLCNNNGNPREELLESDIEALSVYKGGFLPNMSSETWVFPVAAYYHNCYVSCLMEIVPMMLTAKRYHEVAELCREAILVEPFNEEIHRHFMNALLLMGDREGAARVYQMLRESLFSNFGILPAEETRSLYYEATKTINDHAIEIEVLQEQLREDYRDGALICEFDFFRVLYHSMARSMARNGMAAHIAMLSVTDKKRGQLPQKKRENIMISLEDQIRISLRRGDAAARCSVSQFVVLLPGANYENSCMVCDRVIRSFYKKHTRCDADIQYTVYPMRPDIKEVSQWNRELVRN